MRNASKVSFISIILISIAVVTMSVFEVINDTFVSLITIITAIVGAFGIWLELNKEQEINQASFILSINSDFYALGGKGTMYAADLEKMLDEDFSGVKKLELTKEHQTMVIQYLVWVKTLSSLINRRMIKISAIDDLFSYKFFVAVNNPEIQKMELIPYKTAYRGIFKAHKIWKKYREKHGLEIYNEKTDLSTVEGYTELSK
ncbi:MAG: hypothetical protein E7341_00720 [Clostridiales bacterium]|nr:hypothetical protein [Clostridiales bacterium]